MKFIIIALFVIAFNVNCKAQTLIKTSSYEVGYWNDYTNSWDWKERKPCSINFVLQGNLILSDDNAKSTYYIYQIIDNTFPDASWKALDEKKRQCVISIISKSNYTYFTIMYDNLCIRYTY